MSATIDQRWRAHGLSLPTLSRLQDTHPEHRARDREAWLEALHIALDALDAAAVKLQNYQELARASGDRLAAQLQTEAQNADRLRVVNMRGRNACNVEIQRVARLGEINVSTRAACERVLMALDEDRT